MAKNCRNSIKLIRNKSQNDYSIIDSNEIHTISKYINSKDNKRYLIKNNNANRSAERIIIEAKNISKEKNNNLRSTLILPSSSIKKIMIKLIDDSKIMLPFQISSSKNLNLNNIK